MREILTSRHRIIGDMLAVTAIVAIIGGSWLFVTNGGLADLRPLRNSYYTIFAYGYAVLALAPFLAAKGVAGTVARLVIAPIMVLFTADLTTMRYFGSPFLQLYPYLPVTAQNASPAAIMSYATSYVPTGIALLGVGAVLSCLLAAYWVREQGRARLAVLVLIPATYGGIWLSTVTFDRPAPGIDALLAEPEMQHHGLHGANRSDSFALSGPAMATPETIILMIMESAGADLSSSDGRRLLTEQIVADSGSGSDSWVNFDNAVTNSNASDISVPTILTGSGPHESVEKVHALPFLTQFAEARGYRRAFITSSTMHWAGFEKFLAAPAIGEIIAAESFNSPFVNDVAVDDYHVFRSAARTISQANGKLFLTLYPQAFHWPLQAESKFPIPTSLKSRRARASAITEAGFRMLFAALAESGRLDDTMMVIVGDHGEFDYSARLQLPKRVSTFEGGILSPMFLIKAPESLPPTGLRALRANAGRLVANQDIAPTLAQLLSAQLRSDLRYDGYSLLDAVPHNRIAFATSTNQWRNWPESAVAVARGSERLLCDNEHLCRRFTAQGTRLAGARAAGPGDELFEIARRHAVLRSALGQIYDSYY